MSFHVLSRRSVAAAIALVVAALPACDKLKSLASKDADAAAPAASAGAGGSDRSTGILSFLGSEFEGEVTMTMTVTKSPQGGPIQIVYGIKKPKYRVDVTTPPPSTTSTVLFDLPTKKGYMLVHAQKLAMVLDFDATKGLSKPRGGLDTPSNTPSSQPPKIEKTGKNDVVAGYSCEIWNVTSEGRRAELCVADGITWLDVGDLGLTAPGLAIAAVTTEANRFPLRVISFDAYGKEETRMEATKVEKKKLDDASFVVPPDYKVVDMPALMKGFKGIPSGLPSLPQPPR